MIACASGVWICVMSHWSPDRLSESVAGAFGNPLGASAAADCSSPDTCVAKPAVEAALWIRPSATSFWRNDVLSDLAIATPICG